MNETRQELYERVSAMCGLDPDGGIIPPPAGLKINQEPVSWWRNRVTYEPYIVEMTGMEWISLSDEERAKWRFVKHGPINRDVAFYEKIS